MTSESSGAGGLAEQYAQELDAQFRRLNNFVSRSGGEIGRTHEAYLRGVLSRFLPPRYRLGSGFVHGTRGTSPQQDIIIFEALHYPLLLEVGDCVVVDEAALVGTIEVKTKLESDHVKTWLDREPNPPFSGLFAWSGISPETLFDVLWDYVRKDPWRNRGRLPIAVYVLGEYLLVRIDDGKWNTPPLRLLRIDEHKFSDGQALLAFVQRIYQYGRLNEQTVAPWWLFDEASKAIDQAEPVRWPSDLFSAIQGEVAKRMGSEAAAIPSD